MTTVGMTCNMRLTDLSSNDGILQRDSDEVPGHQAG